MSRPAAAREVRVDPPLSARQARHLHLAVQGLLTPPRARATPARLLAAIARMRLLQIDTIHVVARSPYLVLFSRLGDYDPRWLDQALADGRLFECWAHEACFASIEDLALHHVASAVRANHWAYQHARRMHREHRAGMDRLLAHIRERGAVKAADFARRRKGAAGWWAWKDEKRWLEALFALGELMIARRENFQRVYDLRERVLARAGIGPVVAPADPARELLLGAVHALGVTQARWIADYFRTGRKHTDADLQGFVERGELIRVAVRGWNVPGYVHVAHRPLLERARRGGLRATYTTLLSPFDPVVWDRERARTLFGFDYTLECYTPAPRRPGRAARRQGSSRRWRVRDQGAPSRSRRGGGCGAVRRRRRGDRRLRALARHAAGRAAAERSAGGGPGTAGGAGRSRARRRARLSAPAGRGSARRGPGRMAASGFVAVLLQSAMKTFTLPRPSASVPAARAIRHVGRAGAHDRDDQRRRPRSQGLGGVGVARAQRQRQRHRTHPATHPAGRRAPALRAARRRAQPDHAPHQHDRRIAAGSVRRVLLRADPRHLARRARARPQPAGVEFARQPAGGGRGAARDARARRRSADHVAARRCRIPGPSVAGRAAGGAVEFAGRRTPLSGVQHRQL